MRLKNIFVVALAAVTLFSCTKEITKFVDKPEGTTRIKVGISPDLQTTRAGHTDLKPTTDELKIYNYALFIFNSSGMLEASLIATPYSKDDPDPAPKDYDYADPDYSLTFTQGDNPNLDDDGVLTLSAGTKMFFAIVNAPAQLLQVQERYLYDNTLNRQTLTSEKLTFEDLNAIVGSYNVDEDGDPVSGANVYFYNPVTQTKNNRGFMMTTVGTTGYEERVLPELEDGQFEEVTLSVGRAMAKVSLGTELPNTITELTPNGTLDVESYKIINNPEAMYIMPNITNNVLVTPYYFNTVTTQGNYFESHNSVLPNNNNYVTVSTDAAKTFTYCIENANLTPRQGNATIAIVKGVFTPGGGAAMYESPLDQTATGETSFTKGQTFYRIWIPQYTRTDDSQLAGGRYDNNYYSLDPTDDLDDYVLAAQANMAWPSTIQLVVEKFTDGVCYYRLPLYNDKNAMAPYTVKRNSYYKIDIVSVTDAGYTDENGGGGNTVDPEEPLEPQTHITVDIKVLDWEEIEQGGKL